MVGAARARGTRVWGVITAYAAREGSAVSLQHAVVACADALSAVGAGLVVAQPGARQEQFLASAPAAEELETLQVSLGQGPGMDAVARRGPVLVNDISRHDALRRWPRFAVAASERGVRGMAAFPVGVGAALLGVLDVYRLRGGPLSPGELADGLLFADALLILALDKRGGITRGADDDVPDGMVSVRRVQVHQATGMVAAQLGLSMPDALTALRARAQASGQRLSDLAADMLARRVRLERSDQRCPEEE
jgi:hypothetical protein